MSYESDRHAKEQDATEAMIRMRKPVVKTPQWEKRAREAEGLINELIQAVEQLLKCHDAQSEQWAREAIKESQRYRHD